MIAIKTKRGVAIASALSTLASVIVAEAITLAMFPLGSDNNAFMITLIITVLTAFPVSFFSWSIVRTNHTLTEELQRMVNRDRLTDAATRDFFFARMAAAPHAFGVSLMVDIDHFKTINDTHGHLAGDRVIAQVAELLRGCVRPNDIVRRFGGEEFVVFLDGSDWSEGLIAAERMRQQIEACRDWIDAREIAVTVSIGGSMKEAVADITQAINAADEALYRAKAQGRNRTIFAPSNRVAMAATA